MHGLRAGRRGLTPRAGVLAADGRRGCRAAGARSAAARTRRATSATDDARSLVFETAPLDATIEILGAPVVTLDVASDKPLANLAVRLCDVHPDGASLRVSFGILNLTHRDGHEAPSPLVPGQRYRVRIKLNDAGFGVPARTPDQARDFHRLLADDLAEPGARDCDRLRRHARSAGAASRAPPTRCCRRCPEPETARSPKRDDRLVRAWCGSTGSASNSAPRAASTSHIDDDDPLSAVVEMRQTQTVSRGAWRTRIETHMRMSCTHDAFLLRATMRAWDGDAEIRHRAWDSKISRDFV